MTEQSKTRIVIVLLLIIASTDTDLFGDNMLRGLQIIRHVLIAEITQFQLDSATPLSDESMLEMLTLCQSME